MKNNSSDSMISLSQRRCQDGMHAISSLCPLHITSRFNRRRSFSSNMLCRAWTTLIALRIVRLPLLICQASITTPNEPLPRTITASNLRLNSYGRSFWFAIVPLHAPIRRRLMGAIWYRQNKYTHSPIMTVHPIGTTIEINNFFWAWSLQEEAHCWLD